MRGICAAVQLIPEARGCAATWLLLRWTDRRMTDRTATSPEMEVLDVLLGEDVRLDRVRALYSSDERCLRATALMIDDGQVRLLNGAGDELPPWQRRAILADPKSWRSGTGYQLSITKAYPE